MSYRFKEFGAVKALNSFEFGNNLRGFVMFQLFNSLTL
jgi:hypothetical protein